MDDLTIGGGVDGKVERKAAESTHAIHQLQTRDGELYDQHGQRFDTEQYSRFKYGSEKAARSYGHKMARELMQTNPDILTAEKLVIAGSPYKFVRTASSAITRFCTDAINLARLSKGLPPAMPLKIHRKSVFQGDYGTLTAAERIALMSQNTISIDTDLIKDAVFLVVDDIKITGAHEKIIRDLAGTLPQHAIFSYVAALDREEAMAHPQIEHDLNHAGAVTLDKILENIANNDCVINARLCKFILSQKDPQQLKDFLGKLNDKFLYLLFTGVIGDGYLHMEQYKDNGAIIKEEVAKRGFFNEVFPVELPQ
jgi:PRTase ComF-like